MRHAAKMWFALLAIVAFCATGLVLAQQTRIKKVPLPKTSPASGEQMYEAYCAACHGKNGDGNGPAAVALKIPPKNLRTLAKRNGGKFPMQHVVGVLEFGIPVAAHGTSEMPVWGPLFSSLHAHEIHNREAHVKMRISNVARFLESLQEK